MKIKKDAIVISKVTGRKLVATEYEIDKTGNTVRIKIEDEGWWPAWRFYFRNEEDKKDILADFLSNIKLRFIDIKIGPNGDIVGTLKVVE